MLIIILIVCLVGLDQLTKQIIVSKLYLGESCPVIEGFFDIVRVHNDGAAFGILSGYRATLIIFTLVMFFLLYYLYKETVSRKLIGKIVFSVITSGIIGNFIDRVLHGYVIDFLDFHVKESYHFPAFNVADICITCGIFVYFILALLCKKEEEKDNAKC